jgi:hypothetical protein
MAKPLDPRLRQYIGALVADKYTVNEIRELLIQSCLVCCDTACVFSDLPEDERKEALAALENRLRRMSLGRILATLNNMIPGPSYPPARPV